MTLFCNIRYFGRGKKRLSVNIDWYDVCDLHKFCKLTKYPTHIKRKHNLVKIIFPAKHICYCKLVIINVIWGLAWSIFWAVCIGWPSSLLTVVLLLSEDRMHCRKNHKFLTQQHQTTFPLCSWQKSHAVVDRATTGPCQVNVDFL